MRDGGPARRRGGPEARGPAEGTLPAAERFAPETLDEVAALLLAVEGDSRARMTGGALVVEGDEGGRPLAMVLDLTHVPELNRLEFDERLGLRLGAAATLREVAGFPPVTGYAILTDGIQAAAPGGMDVRLGELLAWPAGAGHVACPLICMRGSAAIFGPHGWSEVAIEALFPTSGAAPLQRREFLVDVRLPPAPPGSAGAYRCLDAPAHRPGGAAAFLVMEDARTCCGARLSLWSTTCAPARALEAERFLSGKRLEEAIIAEAVLLAGAGCGVAGIGGDPLALAIRSAADRVAGC